MGQAKKYIRNVYSVLDAGRACDVMWETLEEVYGRVDVIVEDALQSIQRPAKSIDHNRKACWNSEQTCIMFRAFYVP